VRVLVVEDEAFLAELVRLALEADGHDCHTAGTIESATEILRSVRIDVLTLDLVMGGMDPLDWLEETILGYPDLHGRVFILTGRLLDHDQSLRVRGCGARVIQKPFTLHQLREIVRMMTPLSAVLSVAGPREPEAEA
jgi:DNA-binding response OmpR family regulator